MRNSDFNITYLNEVITRSGSFVDPQCMADAVFALEMAVSEISINKRKVDLSRHTMQAANRDKLAYEGYPRLANIEIKDLSM